MNKRFFVWPLAVVFTVVGYLVTSRLIDTKAIQADKAGETAIVLVVLLFAPFMVALIIGRIMDKEQQHGNPATPKEIEAALRARRDYAGVNESIEGWKIIMIVGGIALALLFIAAKTAGR